MLTMRMKGPADQRKLVGSYLTARERVIEHGFGSEIDWQESLRFERLSESDFLREAAWVVLSAGFREKIIRSRFPAISAAFMGWVGAEEIVQNQLGCLARALCVFNHPGKMAAIVSICKTVATEGFGRIRERILVEGIDFLQTLAYIGPTTRYHLAKNIGMDVVKPDRHLLRIAQAARCSSPNELCQLIADVTGDRLSVVDIVMWRYATMDPHYVLLFQV